MYAGQIVERAPVEALFARPEHPYTVGLLGSIPRLDEKRERLPSIEGRVPDMTRPPDGCRFAARCPFVEPPAAPRRRRSVEVGARPSQPLPPRAAGSGVLPMTGALLEVEGLVKHFRCAAASFGRTSGHVRAVDGVDFTVKAGETLAAGRRVGLRQVDGRPAGAAPDRADRRRRALRGRGLLALEPSAMRAPPPAHAGDLPGPVRLAQSAHDGGRHAGRAAGAARLVADEAAAPRARRASCSSWSGSARACAALSARILRRPAPAPRDRPRARGRAEADRGRRAGLGARRLDPGAGAST